MKRFLLGLGLGVLLIAPLPLLADPIQPILASHPIVGRLATPMLGDHVTEPTPAVTGIRFRLYAYPLATHPDSLQSVRNDSGVITKVGCNFEPVNFNGIRFETNVHVAGLVGSARENPSEHWNEELFLYKWVKVNGRDRLQYEWNVEWRHANVPPHAKPSAGTDRGWEDSQNNQNVGGYLQGTRLQFFHELRGSVSGVILTETCDVTVGIGSDGVPPPTTTTTACIPGSSACPTSTTEAPTTTTVAETTTTAEVTTTTLAP